MPAEIIVVDGHSTGTANFNYITDITFSHRVDFLNRPNVRILSITSSGWILSMRDSAEGGSRNSMPMLWVTLLGQNRDVVGPTHTALDFTGADGLILYLKVPHFLIADTLHQAEWHFDMRASCYYELI